MNAIPNKQDIQQPAARTASMPACEDPRLTWGTIFYRLLVGLAVLAASALAANAQQAPDDPNLEPGNVILPVNSGIGVRRGASVGGDNADRPLLPVTDSILNAQNYTTAPDTSPLSAQRQNYTTPVPEGDMSQYNGGYSAPPAQGAPVFPGYGTPYVPQPSWAVSPVDFQALLTAINNQTFASNQLPMVQAAGLCGWFTCSQCAAIMNCFDFDSNRLQVVRYLAPHIIDPIRCQPIMDQLSFSDDRQTAWRILSGARL